VSLAGRFDPVDDHTETDGTEQAEPKGRRDWHQAFRRRTWDEIAPVAHLWAFGAWLAAIVLVAVARVRPWNEWRSWRRWLRADSRGWEILIPGLLLGLAAFTFVRAQELWQRGEGWSPRLVGLVAIGLGSGVGGVLWGLYTLGLRPFGV
jgi:hypothetical protein